MSKPVGPQRFVVDYDAIATRLFQHIVTFAMKVLESRVLLDGAVDPGAQGLLRDKLLQAGFTAVHFHTGQRDGNYVEALGNPYASGNIAKRAALCVDDMNELIKKAKMHDGRVIVDYRVPEPVQAEVHRAFTAPEVGWKNVEFISDQREGDSVILSV